jgi:hypothetical protein
METSLAQNNPETDMKEGIDFSLIDYTDPAGEKFTAFNILAGEFTGVIYNYGKVKVDENEVPPKLSFNYRIIDSGKHDIDELCSNEDYIKIMGDILVKVLIDQLGEVDAKNRTNNSEKLDSQ